jgi:hypothetical protein
MLTLGLSAAWFTRMSAAVLKVEQLIGVIPDEQRYLFSQRHWARKIGNNILHVWFFLFDTHRTPFRRQGNMQTIKIRLKSIFKICCIVFNFNL